MKVVYFSQKLKKWKKMWEIVKSAKLENKREISINGQQLTELLEANYGKIDMNLFKLNQLNLLRLSNSPALIEINGKLNDLSQLQSLLMFGNKLTAIPGKYLNYSKIYHKINYKFF